MTGETAIPVFSLVPKGRVTMYQINWTDTHTGNEKTLRVHTLRAARLVVNTLQADVHNRFRYIELKHIAGPRLRELVVIFEK